MTHLAYDRTVATTVRKPLGLFTRIIKMSGRPHIGTVARATSGRSGRSVGSSVVHERG